MQTPTTSSLTTFRIEVEDIEGFLEDHGVEELVSSTAAPRQLQEGDVEPGGLYGTYPVHSTLYIGGKKIFNFNL